MAIKCVAPNCDRTHSAGFRLSRAPDGWRCQEHLLVTSPYESAGYPSRYASTIDWSGGIEVVSNEFKFYQQPDPYRELPALAERLGVGQHASPDGVCLVTADGRRYNLFELINAFLDRIDQATKESAGQ